MGKWIFESDCNIGDCPVCGDSIDHLQDDDTGNTIQESYTCDLCDLIITYEWKKPTGYDDRHKKRHLDAKEADRLEQDERLARWSGKLLFERRR
jgi:hypothetical protein